MQEPVSVSKTNLELGCIGKKDVITTDGRNIGTLSGAWIDTTAWTVISLVVDLNKDVVSELNVKKPILRTAKVNVPTANIKNIADVVQLNSDITNLGSILTSP
ncbi:MAG: PRC-barrel domain-containing protein [Methanomassiliicoccus sp.]|nr:PRC-barrel domain-containing protein [Methanomassiliicoccus sp.]